VKNTKGNDDPKKRKTITNIYLFDKEFCLQQINQSQVNFDDETRSGQKQLLLPPLHN